MLAGVRARLVLGVFLLSCSKSQGIADVLDGPAPGPSETLEAASCGGGGRLRAHFYDVGQGLAVLVDLPDGRHVLVDTGGGARRACEDGCKSNARRLIDALRVDLQGAPVDVLWITHQHADHIGGVPDVLAAYRVGTYVDNGRDMDKAEVRRARRAAAEHGTLVQVIDPHHATVPLTASESLKITPIVPSAWPASCARDANECSIGLRVDFCASSILFTGDAEHEEEKLLDTGGPVTLLQVAHHGSDTSTTPGFLMKARPKYAVVSAGKAGEGLNVDYCHPRALVIQRLTLLLGGAGSRTLSAFDGERCSGARPGDWVSVPASDRLWATERDGDVVLTTGGDGAFARE
jgi:competence protein ComEC